MAHINHYRLIDQVQRLSIDEVLSYGASNNSFGAFGGVKAQRDLVGLHQISRNLGEKGIILVHNDPDFESKLSHVYELNPDLALRVRTPSMFLANSQESYHSFYDPLYGLSSGEVLDVIAPVSNDRNGLTDVYSVRSILADYLTIISYQFSSNPAAFGKYPYNLDLLYELTGLPYSELYRNVIDWLPADQFEALSRRLSAPDAQQKAFNAVRSFSISLEKGLWQYQGFARHSRLSIIDAVLGGNLISIYVPGSRKEILDYIAAECRALNDSSIPYLLITSHIAISESPEFKKLFLSEHAALPYSTGILAETLSTIIDSSSGREYSGSGRMDLASLFSQMQDLFVFSCPNTLAAIPFSEGIGSYYRQVSEQHSDVHREAFHLFSTRSYGISTRETQQAIINPEELTALGDGCLIYGSRHRIPILARHFTF